MKKILLLCLVVLATQITFSQENYTKPYLTGSLNVTFAVNENYTIDPDGDEAFLVPGASLLRFGAGYQFHRRWQASLNAGIDFHYRFDILAIPFYGSLRYNIIERENDNLFIEYSLGEMWRPSAKFENGNYYGFGIGVQVTGESRWNTIVRLDYHRKAIQGFENGHLDSLSLGVGFSFF